MWQGNSQVEAPVIELEQGARRMTASGVGEAMQVHTVLLAEGNASGKAKPVSGEAGEWAECGAGFEPGDGVYGWAAGGGLYRGSDGG